MSKENYIDQYAKSSGGIIEIEGIIPRKTVEFYAFVSSFSDSMTSNWSEEIVYGRADPIGTFQNTIRKISISFALPSANLTEAKKNLHKVNQVKQFMYPAYSTNSQVADEVTVTTNALSLAKSPVVRIKFANLIQNNNEKGLLGWIGSFNANPLIDMGMFNESHMLFPKVYEVSLDFTPQHEFDLGYKSSSDGTALDEDKFPNFPYTGGSKK